MQRDAISDPDRFDAVRVYAIAAEGEPLPDWLHFDEASLTLSGTPAAADAGVHEILLIAADSNGAASIGSLTLAVAGDVSAPDPESPAESPVNDVTGAPAIDAPVPLIRATDALPRRTEIVADTPLSSPGVEKQTRVGVPADPLFREMQQRFDVLLQVGRPNLGERYSEAVREFEERRQQREEQELPPTPTEPEIEAWNSAMHSWHDRNPGFAESDLGGNDGTWSMGWGLPGSGDSVLGGAAASAVPGLSNSLAQARLGGVAAAPMLSEGLRDIR